MKETIRIARQRDMQAVQDAVTGWWKEDRRKAVHRLDWWKKARFGCFIHWGVYAVAAGEYKGRTTGYAEHLERALMISQDEYLHEMIEKFTAESFDAEQWIREAKNAGMEYFIITAKHHDGFAMYPSEVYPYDIRMTPFGRNGRDPMRELKDACDRYGLRFGFYYSHAFDWEHPKAPGNDWEYHNPGGDLHLYEEDYGLWYYDHPELLEGVKEYVDQKSIPQILELIRNYHPDILWFDTPHKLPLSENLRILKAIREADSQVVVNGRLAGSSSFPSFGDYYNTADRPAILYPSPGYWEGIPTTNESYGYHKLDHSHKPASFFMKLLSQSAARGGNMLMNIGPRGDGTWAPEDLAILRPLGAWVQDHRESLYDVGRNPLPKQWFGEVTCSAETLYLHVYQSDADGSIVLSGLLNPIEAIYMLGDEEHKELAYDPLGYYDVRIWLPDVNGPCVVVVKVAGRVEAYPVRRLRDQGEDCLHVFDADLKSAGLSYGQGKISNDYVYGFTDTTQQILWHIRNQGIRRYRAEVTYMVRSEGSGGEYCLRIGQHEYVRTIDASAPLTYVTDTLDVEFSGMDAGGTYDLQLMPVRIEGDFAAFRSVTLYPLEEAEEWMEIPEEDDTDTGENTGVI